MKQTRWKVLYDSGKQCNATGEVGWKSTTVHSTGAVATLLHTVVVRLCKETEIREIPYRDIPRNKASFKLDRSKD